MDPKHCFHLHHSQHFVYQNKAMQFNRTPLQILIMPSLESHKIGTQHIVLFPRIILVFYILNQTNIGVPGESHIDISNALVLSGNIPKLPNLVFLSLLYPISCTQSKKPRSYNRSFLTVSGLRTALLGVSTLLTAALFIYSWLL